MHTFEVYKVYPISIVKAKGCELTDSEGKKYLDFYGGHGVISIGHCQDDYVKGVAEQLSTLGFYSNSVQIPQQEELAIHLTKISGYTDYKLFLCNSGAEANENALKLASFYTNRSKVIAFKHSFHGRTSLAVAVTDNPKIQAPVNETDKVLWAELNNIESVKALMDNDVAAVIIEGIQGVGGVQMPTTEFMKQLRELCTQNGSLLIVDEIQSGYGRTGKFFAHQHHDVKADIISMAKGIANGFPVGAILINPEIKAVFGMLGTTFGGNHLGCRAAIETVKVMEKNNYVENAAKMGKYLKEKLSLNKEIKDLRGEGLIIGVEPKGNASELRDKLLFDYHIFTGFSGSVNTIRLIPPLCITKKEADMFIEAFFKATNQPLPTK
ncbi:MAG: aminotransferase class III-fold pyridoxal phosphate-dependent enzyme [Bacteroidales bacterium]|nr:aminotransferase class III-fold pyridoxal phosphate-dependent enzyme [Bacteroidales bacterium]